MTNKCKSTVCERKSKCGGYCDAHYRMSKKGLDPNTPLKVYEPRDPNRLCTIEGCTNKNLAKGLCTVHHARGVRTTEKYRSYSKAYRSEPNRRFRQAKSNAKCKDVEWTLTFEEWYEAAYKPCTYGEGPLHVLALTGIGLDRVDSSLGYIPGNVVSCCYRCNKAKSEDSLALFEAWAKSLHCVKA